MNLPHRHTYVPKLIFNVYLRMCAQWVHTFSNESSFSLAARRCRVALCVWMKNHMINYSTILTLIKFYSMRLPLTVSQWIPTTQFTMSHSFRSNLLFKPHRRWRVGVPMYVGIKMTNKQVVRSVDKPVFRIVNSIRDDLVNAKRFDAFCCLRQDPERLNIVCLGIFHFCKCEFEFEFVVVVIVVMIMSIWAYFEVNYELWLPRNGLADSGMCFVLPYANSRQHQLNTI